MSTTELATRVATADDLPAILELLRRSMGRGDDDRFDALFRWKHIENAFGPSPMWVACDGERIVGLRTFMRWEWLHNGDVVRTVRAVDTATDPEYQGRGIFKRLTLDALPALTDDGVQFIFNTPNGQSRPGYLKMGWRAVGSAPARVRPLSLRGLVALRGSRVPATHWSEPIALGVDVERVVGDAALERLLALAQPNDDHYRTRVTSASLAWRFGSSLLGYRAIVGDRGVADGVAVVRVRRRGAAREGVVGLLLAPDVRSRRALSRRIRRELKPVSDYLLAVGDAPGTVPIPRLGPIVTTRPVAGTAPDRVAALKLSLGDIELF